ncbi:hypothetical protein MJI95_21630 [Salmonella enterica subsp. enterica serovar Kentucky]|nr:hypothetical protein [Salmonella enterica subsp. enterica serovar Kentucky]
MIAPALSGRSAGQRRRSAGANRSQPV